MKHRIIGFRLISLIMIIAIPFSLFSQGNIIGKWKYTFPGGEMIMQITSNTVIIDGLSYPYKIENDHLLVSEGNSFVSYPFTIKGTQLNLGFPDGTQITFMREPDGTAGPIKIPPGTQTPSEKHTSDLPSSSLIGRWVFQSQQGELILEFMPGNQVSFNGQTTQYQLIEGIIQAMGDHGWLNYPYTLDQGTLVITFPEGIQVPFKRASSSSGMSPTVQSPQSQGSGLNWQLQGSLCYYAGSSNYYSSYSRTEKISFDGNGNFIFGREGSFSSDAGLAYSGNPNAERGTYRVEERFVMLQFQSGETIRVNINMRQDNGRITELMYEGKLYAVALCE